ncbi:MAG: hypothetical protein MUF75_01880 [Bacteroidia bacterium]|jgi:hypothetical protein|nr:hypothetical protein [Bacteroidia bacterium]
MKVFDYFTIGKLDVYNEPLIDSSWKDINEAIEIINEIEDVRWRLPTLGEIKFLHENKSEMKFEIGDYWFFSKDGQPRIYVEELGVCKVKPACKFPALLVKDTNVTSEAP